MKTLLTAMMMVSLALCAPASASDPLAGVKGEKRVLLLFAKSRSDAALDQQVDLFRERRPDMTDRDLVLLVSAGSQDTMAAIGYLSLDRGSNRRLREQFMPGERGLTMVLVGLDGTGDQTAQTQFTIQSIRNMLNQLGVTLPPTANPQLKNVAAVMVHADLPPFAKMG